MIKIGVLKNQILGKLTESYSKKNKKEIKNIISLLKENNDFKQLYLFYDEFENKYFKDKDGAKLYMESFIPFLKENHDNLIKDKKFISNLSNLVGDVEVEKTPLYENLDNLLTKKTINNIETRIEAENNILEHLLTKKDEVVLEDTPIVTNESLFHSILTNNFNVLYENELDEEQKKELKSVLSITNKELEIETEVLKEEILNKISDLLTESTEVSVLDKLDETKREIISMRTTRYNLYKLQELKNGL